MEAIMANGQRTDRRRQPRARAKERSALQDLPQPAARARTIKGGASPTLFQYCASGKHLSEGDGLDAIQRLQ